MILAATRILAAIGDEIPLYAELPAGPERDATVTWRDAGGAVLARSVVHASPLGPTPVPAFAVALTGSATVTNVTVDADGATVPITIEWQGDGPSGVDLGLKPMSATLAPLVRLSASPVAGGVRARVDVAAFNAVGNGTFSWNGFAYAGTNESSVESVEVYLDRTLVGTVRTTPGAKEDSVVVDVDLSSASEGRHVLTAVAYQGAPDARIGRLASTWIVADRTPPRVEILSPEPGANVSRRTIVRGTAADVSGVASLTVNGVPADTSDAFAHWTATVALSPVDGGGGADFDALIEAVATDGCGNVTRLAMRVHVGALTDSYSLVAQSRAARTSRIAVTVGDLDGDGIVDDLSEGWWGKLEVALGRGDGTFADPVTVVPAGYQTVTLGDLNLDGLNDIVRVGVEDGIAIDVNTTSRAGSPSFAQPIVLRPVVAPAGDPRPEIYDQAVITDMNGDGVPDLVALVRAECRAFVYVNLTATRGGAVTFAARVLATPTRPGEYLPKPSSIAVVDLDGDGRRDVVVGSTMEIRTYRNVTASDGRVAFEPGLTLAGSVPFAVVDLTGDGRPDIFARRRQLDDQLRMYVNETTGSSVAFRSVDVGVGPLHTLAIVPADLNGDGIMDLGLGGVSEVVLLLATLSTPGSDPSFQSSTLDFYGGVPLAFVDVTGDGRLDAVAGGHVLVRDSRPTFVPRFEQARRIESSFLGRTSVEIGDVNADRRGDVVVGRPDGFTVHAGAGSLAGEDVTFAPPVAVTVPGSRSWTVTVADVNRDGRADVVGAAEDGNVYVCLATADPCGTPTFAPPLAIPIPTSGAGCTFADLDQDGADDLIVNDRYALRAYVFRNLTARGASRAEFGPRVAIPLDTWWATASSFLSASPGDFDQDGRIDLAFAVETGVVVFKNETTRGGELTFRQAAGAFVPMEQNTHSLAVGDLDGDGAPDIVVGTTSDYGYVIPNSGQMPTGYAILRNHGRRGEMSFDPLVLVAGDAAVVRLVDADGNGSLDLITTGRYWAEVGVRPNVSDRARNAIVFSPPRVYVLVRTGVIRALAVGDVDGDGVIDVVEVGYDEVRVARGRR